MGVYHRSVVKVDRSQYHHGSSCEGDDRSEQLPRYHEGTSKNHGRVGIHRILMSQWWRFRSNLHLLSVLLLMLVSVTFFACLFWHLGSTIPLYQPRVVHLANYMFKDGDPRSGRPRTVEPMSWYSQEDPSREQMLEANRVVSVEETLGCPFIADWQRRTGAYPTCNQLHEVGFRIMGEEENDSNRLQYLDSGGYNDVWFVIREGSAVPEDFVLKTSVFRRHYTPHDINHHQIDALIMEQTTASPYVLNMYAYCGKSSLVERATGMLKHWVKEYKTSATPIELLQVAHSLAQGVADMQLFHNGMATCAHADVKVSQFLMTEDSIGFKINDFNRGRLLTSKNPPEICPFTMSNHHVNNINRSPEEYTDNGAQTDKIDVFALGSVLYYLLMGTKPFATVEYKEAVQLARDGVHPELDEKYLKSTDPSIKAIVDAMEWTWKYDRNERPQSREVARLLKEKMQTLENELQE